MNPEPADAGPSSPAPVRTIESGGQARSAPLVPRDMTRVALRAAAVALSVVDTFHHAEVGRSVDCAEVGRQLREIRGAVDVLLAQVDGA